jgi:hypothetical protein
LDCRNLYGKELIYFFLGYKSVWATGCRGYSRKTCIFFLFFCYWRYSPSRNVASYSATGATVHHEKSLRLLLLLALQSITKRRFFCSCPPFFLVLQLSPLIPNAHFLHISFHRIQPPNSRPAYSSNTLRFMEHSSCMGLAPAFYRGIPATPTFLLSSTSRFLVHYAQNPLSSRLISKNKKIKIYRTIILPVVLYGCETWSLTLRNVG